MSKRLAQDLSQDSDLAPAKPDASLAPAKPDASQAASVEDAPIRIIMIHPERKTLSKVAGELRELTRGRLRILSSRKGDKGDRLLYAELDKK